MNDRFPDGWWNQVELIECRYCPWCGEPFPPPLWAEHLQAITALGLKPGHQDVPAKFRTDTWWREAGL